MPVLHHYPFCPQSRFVRLALGELGVEVETVEERPWERRAEFLELNHAGTTPLFLDEEVAAVPGAVTIAEYLDETRGPELAERRLLPDTVLERVEVRRLLDWFMRKFDEEVTGTSLRKRSISASWERRTGVARRTCARSARRVPISVIICATSVI